MVGVSVSQRTLLTARKVEGVRMRAELWSNDPSALVEFKGDGGPINLVRLSLDGLKAARELLGAAIDRIEGVA